ncbi:hypothetical protein GE289_000478 [Escherichia coli]|jgi:hypothetical protein|uniref:Prophage protein n=2 Tax=Escherichia coli TaxID=562 RepID=A0AB74M8X6_ECOLX|nr:hypothetical protein [Escherichia coli]EEC8802931.1 hypothetical protein [Escherichia coli]EEQ4783690.1 hypothetical protein [Escherichia coli]EEQ4929551.1 hypothetical protein [Escherichia coli]EEQ5321096.1 hypothetical protein [Escherichia coli]EEQ7238677.1 hypothetical protein [Escherichia coli]
MNMTRNSKPKEHTMNDIRRISDKELTKMIESAQQLLSRRNPVVEETWWENLLTALTELRERRNNEGAAK